MITLNVDSWFVKYWVRWGCTEYGFKKLTKGYTDYSKIGEDGYFALKVPPGTNLCQLARINLYAFLKTVGVAIFWVGLVLMITSSPIAFAAIIALGFGSVGIAIGLIWLFKVCYNKIRDNVNISDTLPVQYLKSVKGRYCPIIKFNDGTPQDSTS